MIRLLAVATLALALLPASAEAAKFRFGGRSHATPTSQGHRDSSHVVATPSLRSRQGESAAPNQPLHIAAPTTIAAADAADLRGTRPAEPQIWCRSQTVVGGFCVMN
ncbi:conserved exported hypothetical protein [Bosea sp. 62]|uniref:hypothetical protein n=1 Tax=unclassified Bosea (in: a-proteobacteria) TaxID=2653178 RepID=UPI001255DD76|nr:MULTISPECIES: hypothetical protein [unclassified Bosea (in: a-proteobacteria)]CAD5245924.1 conserved exported hypothetical protein [Bosea sp. 7B]CAD5270317.1 conserved exported hypothetical protein [Bosea sp. 46]VVT51039.1 conserved exported hypothetical protein [Bosea sp. EC-HK365B]VXA92985.1 conserved exported hypothetical protein [Bosea sp. 127]VXB96822.1 conserved exported hypothetical protein [Bosea sp. 62]